MWLDIVKLIDNTGARQEVSAWYDKSNAGVQGLTCEGMRGQGKPCTPGVG